MVYHYNGTLYIVVKKGVIYLNNEIKNNRMGTPMKIINHRKNSDIDVEFLDDFHYIKRHQTYANFKSGSIKNPYDKTICGVGYIGVGEYNTGTKNKHTEEYQNWVCMLRRCYDNKLKNKYPAYYDSCIVCDEWHDFQTFSKWYNENIYKVNNERMHIDKDIICRNSRIYSPETCLIVPQRINMLFVEKRKYSDLPTGVKRTKSGKYTSTYNGRHLGTFDLIEDAAIAHDIEKKKTITEIAYDYKDKIPEKLYNALINWKTEYIK